MKLRIQTDYPECKPHPDSYKEVIDIPRTCFRDGCWCIDGKDRKETHWYINIDTLEELLESSTKETLVISKGELTTADITTDIWW